MTAVMLQVRLGSTRLPGKALLPLGGKTLIDLVLESLSLVHADARVVLTDEDSLSELENHAALHGFDIITGPKDDVLARYAKAIHIYSPDVIIRATGDNPLVSWELANMLLDYKASSSAPVDYAAFTGPPIGTGVEVVEAQSLLRAHAKADDRYSREHVCPYLYNNQNMFSIKRIEAPQEYCAQDVSVTVDTPADYEKVASIVSSLYSGEPISTSRLVSFIKTGEYSRTSLDGKYST